MADGGEQAVAWFDVVIRHANLGFDPYAPAVTATQGNGADRHRLFGAYRKEKVEPRERSLVRRDLIARPGGAVKKAHHAVTKPVA